MKVFLTSAFCFFMLSASLFGQQNGVSFKLSLHQAEIGYKYIFKKVPLEGEFYLGAGNQDIDGRFNDFVSGIRIIKPVFRYKRNLISMMFNTGVYIPNNDYYNAVTPVFGLIAGYNRTFDKAGKHSLLINAGYFLGQRYYLQEYKDNFGSYATRDIFKIVPVNIAIGYGLNF
ncbi:MAG: hypothetical protein HC905_01830 [Bacteroidales bacterium]|nr:hypothetical protein [Bacteroidales bacterium]